MAKPELGTKRQCLSCGAKFYDLNKDPIVCPKCSTVFVAQALRGRAEVARAEEGEEPELETGAEIVSLDEVAAGEKAKEGAVDDDVDIEDDIDDDDTFLEEDETSDDDVSDLIDGDIDDDEEA
ncbi:MULTISPECIES: TIGR02300 family protein [unclassified Chelatococcus]|uniref:TIGR02300 family protein n=1 Tax=unclassified Chelatococcus TaxID=2638111 RepID=UPI00031FA0CD|nr:MULTISPECIES: TIGR02300 family protein [unclassified Chelatococcus]ALA17117.1 hypothetical protein AL346_06510 [Chelatococcus sp. CO-6]